MLGEDEEPPEEGEHITFVDVITKAEVRWTQPASRKREYLVITLGNRRPKVTATFFNAKYLKKTLVEDTRLMLSGEVGFFKGTMQLTHPAFLILDGAERRAGAPSRWRRSPRRRSSEDGHAGGVRAGLLPDLPGQRQGAELGHLRLRATGARRARSRSIGSAAGNPFCSNGI